jgi:hypothetical protein
MAGFLLASPQFSFDERAVDDQDLHDGGNSQVGPNIGPGLGFVARGEYFDEDQRIGKHLAVRWRRAGYSDVRDTIIPN